MKVIIAAAGTGGHINPGIAIASKIKKEEPDSNIVFIGTPRGLENDLVPRAGYKLKTINAYGISRELKIENLKRLYYTIHAKKEAKKILEEFKPDIVIGTGGYICIPVAMAAKSLDIPVVLHESNAFPGASVKLLSKTAKSVMIGFEDAKIRLPKAKEIVVTGNPVKISKINVDKEKIRSNLGIKNNKPIVLVFGGSQGAKTINDTILEIILKNMNKEYNLVWATGTNSYDEIKEEIRNNNKNIGTLENTKVLSYIYNMEEMMNACDMIVCRSGAMTIAEIIVVGKPAIFIPFPYASENHQEFNARVLEKKGAAKIILDKDVQANNLNREIEEIVTNKANILDMGEKAKSLCVSNVLDKIYEQVKKYSNENDVKKSRIRS